MDSNRQDYRTMIAINLLWASATAGPMSILSLILRSKGVDIHSIGFIMASNVVGSFIGTLVSGWASVRYGPLRVVITAILCTSIALLSFEWTTAYPIPAILSRLLQGFGFGLFLAAGISYVQSKTSEANQRYAMGMFSAMAIAPYFFAQFEAEWYLNRYGPGGIFAIGAAPFVLALLGALYLLPREQAVKGKPKGGSYIAVLKTPHVYPPFICMMVNGMMFAFGASFMPIMLADSAILIGCYFAPYAITTLAMRFFLVQRLEKLSHPSILAIGMIAMGIAGIIPILSLTTFSVILSGFFYGLGYTFIGPTCIAYATSFFPPSERPRANALVQTFFQGGSIFAPIAAGFFLANAGLYGLTFFMSLIGFLSIILATFMFILSTGSQAAHERA